MPVILRGLRQPVSVDPIEARSREELIELSDDIEASDKEILVADLPDLARETPREALHRSLCGAIWLKWS
jgi:hypothetical protein